MRGFAFDRYAEKRQGSLSVERSPVPLLLYPSHRSHAPLTPEPPPFSAEGRYTAPEMRPKPPVFGLGLHA